MTPPSHRNYLRLDMVRNGLPTGTVAFLFTDVEGSTKLLHELGPEAYADALAEHRRNLREAFQAHGGVEVDTQDQEEALTLLRAHLDEAALSEAWEEGARLTLGEATELALDSRRARG